MGVETAEVDYGEILLSRCKTLQCRTTLEMSSGACTIHVLLSGQRAAEKLVKGLPLIYMALFLATFSVRVLVKFPSRLICLSSQLTDTPSGKVNIDSILS